MPYIQSLLHSIIITKLRLRIRNLPLRKLLYRSKVVNMQKKNKPSGRLTAAARRAQLIEIGREVFAERGYGATSVEEIAARAKVSKPILDHHFGGRCVLP